MESNSRICLKNRTGREGLKAFRIKLITMGIKILEEILADKKSVPPVQVILSTFLSVGLNGSPAFGAWSQLLLPLPKRF